MFYLWISKILFLSMTYRIPIGDQLDTHMSDRRPIGYQHAWLATHQRPAFLIGERHALSRTNMPHQRPTCIIRDRHAWSWTNMPDQRPVKDRHAWSMHACPTGLWWGMSVSNEKCWSRIKHVVSWCDMWVCNQACWSPIKHVSLQWVSNGSPRGLR